MVYLARLLKTLVLITLYDTFLLPLPHNIPLIEKKLEQQTLSESSKETMHIFLDKKEYEYTKPATHILLLL